MREEVAVVSSGEEEEVVMVGAAEEKAGEERSGVVRWERFLPRMFVRVLLVEADDSTRQIIAALLRKCSYRVSAAADGLKAWETLKEKPQNIDLVLTEVELPSVSGFSLLSMIMEHETCRNIPVIMMSSHDSVDMVFKCMLRGAADFLVKPIRKNELRNLWQHVWRRHLSNGGPADTYGHQDENLAQQKFDADSENNAASNHSSDYVACVQKNRERSEKGSDTQSSCTRPDMEAESAYIQNMQEHNQPSCRGSPLLNHTRVHEDEGCNKLEGFLLCESGAEGKECIDAEVTARENVMSTSCIEDANITYETDEGNFGNQSIEVDLIGAIDNQPQCSYGLKKCIAVRGDIFNEVEIPVDGKDNKCKPLLELSLRRYQPPGSANQENDECNTLNHSNYSAFSRYNSMMVLPPISTSSTLRTESKDYFSNSRVTLPNQALHNSTTTSQCNSVTQKMNQEDPESPVVTLLNQEGTAVQCSRVGVLPFPAPISSMAYDNLCAAYGSVMQPIFYTQSGPPVWNTNPATQEVVCLNLPNQSDSETLDGYPHDQNVKKQNQAEKEQDQNMEYLEELRYVSSVTGQSGSSSVCNGSQRHLNSSGCGSVCNGSNGNPTATNVPRTTAQSGNHDLLFTPDGLKMTDFHRSIQREAALNKFRLKRKDRCFEKKVRYQSRKRLAEQRPRVKGQFVRQVQPVPQSMEARSYHCDSRMA